MRLIDADDFGNRMYHEAFEKDTDMQRWDSGCWIRYKLFENVLKEQPTVQPDHTADISKKAEGDCVSRQMAIDAMKDALDPHIVQFVKAKMAKVAIEALPSAQPERKRGEWKRSTDNGYSMYECSVCESRMWKTEYDKAVGTHGFKFCPYCGADMRGGESE